MSLKRLKTQLGNRLVPRGVSLYSRNFIIHKKKIIYLTSDKLSLISILLSSLVNLLLALFFCLVYFFLSFFSSLSDTFKNIHYTNIKSYKVINDHLVYEVLKYNIKICYVMNGYISIKQKRGDNNCNLTSDDFSHKRLLSSLVDFLSLDLIFFRNCSSSFDVFKKNKKNKFQIQ
ncbi:hypothetical protein AGLY_012445 [Aphis glycines]|uniref:Uncharacterized protein n=1 Tax=Aphis glycines TaxID=307491 RepID=A0A6G0TA39_APHGL|nr:hypothetical protein AGLY_012445 [Aphis glycines]